MDLLPKSKSEFSDKDYWNKFFRKRGKEAFEWYGEYTQLCSILHKYMKQNDNILSIGCGNSRLSIELYDVGQYHNNVNIDISELSIKSMNQQYTENRPGLKFIHMDMLKMSFDDGQFNVILDKGTLDALMSDSSELTDKNAELMFSEISRVLKICGRYVCISLLQEHIIKKILSWFPSRGWLLRIHRCQEAEQNLDSNSLVFPVFVVVITKMKALPGISPVMELSLNQGGEIQRVKESKEILKSLSALQHYAIVRHKLSSKSTLENNVQVELHVKDNPVPRYVMHIVDHPTKFSKIKFAIFIVPQGRECEWYFGNKNGQVSLAEKAGCQRLVVVHLHRDHTYESLDSIKSELSSKVVELSPAGLPTNYQIPFLSIGDDIGRREILFRGKNSNTGEYVIEEVFVDSENVFRRLIFLSSQNVIQSEAKVKTVSKKKKKGKKLEKVIDLNYLACSHHKFMIAGLSFLKNKKDVTANADKVLLIGLGGGSLAMFLSHNYQMIHLDVVEIDKDIADIAKNWFEFQEKQHCQLHIEDGLDFIKQQRIAGRVYDAIMFDVNSKDSSAGLSCPPKDFLHADIIKDCFDTLSEKGLLIINLVCRDEDLKQNILNDLKKIFGSVLQKEIENEVNSIVYCLKTKISDFSVKLNLIQEDLHSFNRSIRSSLGNNDLLDVQHFKDTLNII